MLALTPELMLQGLAALFILLWAGKDALKARRDAIKAVQPNPMVAAVSIAWDRDQQERLMQLIERLVVAHEAIVKSQGILADNKQAHLQETIDDLLKRMESIPVPKR